MLYGKSIGKKFHEDGTVRVFPGNTVVAPIRPGCSAYDVMLRLRQMVLEAGQCFPGTAASVSHRRAPHGLFPGYDGIFPGEDPAIRKDGYP